MFSRIQSTSIADLGVGLLARFSAISLHLIEKSLFVLPELFRFVFAGRVSFNRGGGRLDLDASSSAEFVFGPARRARRRCRVRS